MDKASAAEKAGIAAGDVLVTINGNEINDVLDYRFWLADRDVILGLTRGGIPFTARIRGDGFDDIGLEFDTPLMDKKRCCANKCIFCFIDQNPPGMRETIYFKDDDSRLSFLHGNYITLTNIFDKDVERIIRMHISPVRVSVHTTDPELRYEMMKNKRAGKVLSYLDRFAEAGLELNCQIVLCRGINDGPALDRTMRDLLKYTPQLTGVSIVPAGLTSHREGLYPLTGFSAEEAAKVIGQVNSLGEKCKQKLGSRIFFCSDEFYLLAGLPIPDEDYYEDYGQIENGVGMLRSFESDFRAELAFLEPDEIKLPRKVSVATGAAAYGMISRLCRELDIPGLEINVYKIINYFYGETVTVSGLLTGQDIAAQLEGKDLGDELLIPANALRAEDEVFLDDMSIKELETRLGVKITPSGEDGGNFLLNLTGQL